MQINIPQKADISARVSLPILLPVRNEDLEKFQAETFSKKSVFQTSVDFVPEDFSSDEERLAVFELCQVLQSECAEHQFFRAPLSEPVPGWVVINASYPFKEDEIHSEIRRLVQEASRERQEINAAKAEFDTWVEQITLRATELASSIPSKYSECLSKFREVIDENKPGKRGRSARNRIVQRADSVTNDVVTQIPTRSDLYAEFLATLANISPAPSHVLWEDRTDTYAMGMMGRDSYRTAEPGPVIKITAFLVSDFLLKEEIMLIITFKAEGSLVKRVKRTVHVSLPELTRRVRDFPEHRYGE